MEQLVASPVCDPDMDLEKSLRTYSGVGFSKFEAFTGWTAARLDPAGDPEEYRRVADRCGMRIVSVHLPAIRADEDESLGWAVHTARFAHEVGAEVVIFKADSLETYARTAGPFPEAVG
ncbi:MAG: hypothetical protein R6V05_05415 [Candidatus Brocadiia bacterium]